jgi:hypothetical protein
MNAAGKKLLRAYALMTKLYPFEFRRDFREEMQAVFEDTLLENSRKGGSGMLCAFLLELRDWPVNLLAQYLSAFCRLFERGIMSLITEDKSWQIKDRRSAVISALPPVLFGLGVFLGALVIWEPWYLVPRWRLLTGVAIGLIPAVVIALGGLLALVKRLPAWGYTWVGAAMMGLVTFIKALAEDRADFGLPLISPLMDILLAILLLIGLFTLLGISAWRGWRQAGLFSLGLATMAGMASFSMATAAPFNRYDLALLAAPVGLVMTFLIYLYVRRRDMGRIIAILGFGTMNATVFLVIARMWNLPEGGSSPVIPFLVVMTGALLAGPIAAIIGQPIRKIVQGT